MVIFQYGAVPTSTQPNHNLLLHSLSAGSISFKTLTIMQVGQKYANDSVWYESAKFYSETKDAVVSTSTLYLFQWQSFCPSMTPSLFLWVTPKILYHGDADFWLHILPEDKFIWQFVSL